MRIRSPLSKSFIGSAAPLGQGLGTVGAAGTSPCLWHMNCTDGALGKQLIAVRDLEALYCA